MLRLEYEEVKFDNELILEQGSVEFDKGITVLVGENGTGKSTILNLLYRELLNFKPQITLDDILISNSDISEYRNTYVTYISQANVLFNNQSVKESIELVVGEYNQEKLEELLDILSFRNVFNRNPKVSKLSGGEKQKLKIISGLLTNTKIVLLDEPMNNLDSESIGKLNAYLNGDDKYFILTSHIDLVDDYIKYQIKDKKIIHDKVENYHEVIELKKPKHLSKNTLKALRKTNKKIRMPLYIMNIIVVTLLLLGIAHTLKVYRIATIDRSNFIFSDTATLIKAPIGNDSFLTFGKEEWLDTIPTYFSDEDINKIESLDYVENVIPVKSDGYGMNGIDYKNEYILDIPNTDEIEYAFSSALYPKQVAENIPSQSYATGSGFIESFVAGTFPEDESNEVILDTNAADYILEKNEYSSYKELIGKTINVPVVKRDDPSDKEIIKFTISGVFKPIESSDKTVINATIVPGFDTENRFVQSTYTQYQSVDEIYGRLKGTLEAANLDTTIISPEDIPTPAYDSLYIETKTAEDVEKLTKEITDYNQYIEIENNYLYNQSINFKYLSKVIRRNIALAIGLIALFIVILSLLFKLYKNRIEGVVKTLEFYAHSKFEQNKFISFEMNEYLLTIIVSNLLISLLVQFGALNNYNLMLLFTTNIILFISNYIIFRVTMRRRD